MSEDKAGGEELSVGVDDARLATAYLLARESDEYIAVMDVLETSVNDLTPGEVAAALTAAGTPIDVKTVEARLESLRRWIAASARTDTSQILRHADLLARNWRYTATPVGRQVQRFYRNVLAGTPSLREIPLSSLERVVRSLERLAGNPDAPLEEVAEHIGQLFTSHDDLDGALVGAEDALTGLADRFDLDNEATGELKEMLVNYATRVATELERGAARAAAALDILQPHAGALVDAAVTTSEARALIQSGALTASRGGRTEDWAGLAAWFSPDTGRAARFALRLVRALPGMHANLRRLHTSSGTATSRARALALAKAVRDRDLGTAVTLAVLGDHRWRKLYGAADDTDLTRNPAWRDGPSVEIPELLRATGRTGARGRAPAARDNTEATAIVAARRAERLATHRDAVAEVLAAQPGDQLSDGAARVAYASVLAAARRRTRASSRTGECDGLACTLWHTPGVTGVLRARTWQILLPDRQIAFHRRGSVAMPPSSGTATADPGGPVRLIGGVA
ncbi:MAG: DUF2397 domain-containing protein [Mycobacteriales bacterium]